MISRLRGAPPLRLLLGAGVALLSASAVIRLFPFERVVSSAKGSGLRPAASPACARSIRRALEAWARRLPWRTLCFEQGLAAHWLLRRRRLASTLYYGAARIDGELKAHVWVRSGDQDVVGCDRAGDYALLAAFPAEHPSLPVKPPGDREKARGV